jgi:hypothetical protein
MDTLRDDYAVFQQGAVFRREYTFLGLDLTGASAHMQVRDIPGGTVQLDVSSPPVSGSGITIDVSVSSSGQSVSKVVVAAQDDLTVDMTPGNVVFDIKILDASGESIRLIEGNSLVTQQVTT